MKKTMTDLEESITKKAYGKKASPILIEDKSIEGLITGNRKAEPSTWRDRLKHFMI